MEKTFQIGEIARFFDLAPSTLRYWEECGILYDFYKTFVEVFPKERDGQAEPQYSIFLKEN